ncbi:methyltransferase domain-containing protein [Candidatus Parcubacteria bacterium]|nr:MAG: methyltransferase domain-containing protein [Candidatus Parcubacteria bacterium]
MSEREIFRAEKLPVLQNKVFPTLEDAISCPVGDVVLVQNMNTGLIYNAAFDSTLVSYDADYQNEQAHSQTFLRHLENVAAIIDNFFAGKALIEVGCGKGYFLNLLKKRGYSIVGVDPAYEGEDPNIIAASFDPALGITADGLILRHVLEHIPCPVDFLKVLRDANGGKGLIYIEVPCFDWICKNKTWYDIFYEHVNYFRLSDFRKIFSEVVDAGYLFGGQYLYIVADLSSLRDPRASSKDRFDMPSGFLDSVSCYSNVMMKSPGQKNIVWGASSKGVIFSIYMQLYGACVDMAIDINPVKQGKFMPVSGVQISSPEMALRRMRENDNIFVMNSNYYFEILNISGEKYNYYKVDQNAF